MALDSMEVSKIPSKTKIDASKKVDNVEE
jgi:hypothetical protein